MRVPEPRRTLPRLAATLLASAAVATLSVPAAQSAQPAARMAPADLYRSQQWTLNALHIPRSWKYSRGNGVTVAVLDTGVDGHQGDLAGRVIDGPDFTGHLRKPGGRYWGRHGTSMASIIAGHGHGPGGAAGVMGVAPDAKILSIRVTWEIGDPARADHSQTDNSRDSIAQGIRYATDHGAQVISMSLGGGKLFYDGNPLEEAAIKYAESKGVVLVASAGNDGNGANRRNYPAAYPGVIAVGAVDRADRPAKFTNRHTYVSVAAPGVEIVSADIAGHGYILGTGTSSSAAFVAGMSALVKARYPALTSAEVKQALEGGATHRPPDGRSTKVGTGVADALGTLVMASHINKAEHAGAAVRPPGTNHSSPEPAGEKRPDLMLIAILTGGGTLLILSLILGWRQRRRRPLEEESLQPGAAPIEEEPPPLSRSRSRSRYRARARAASAARSASESPREPLPTTPGEARSPWEPRPESESEDPSPWEPRPSTSSPDLSPWEPRSQDPPEAPADISSWDSSREEPAQWGEAPMEMTPWGDPFTETRPGSRHAPSSQTSDEPWESRSPTHEPADASWDFASPSETSRGSHAADASSEAWDSRTESTSEAPWESRSTDTSSETWDSHTESASETPWESRSTEASSETWDSHTTESASEAPWSRSTDASPGAWEPRDDESRSDAWDRTWESRNDGPPSAAWDPPADDPLFGPRPTDTPPGSRSDESPSEAWDPHASAPRRAGSSWDYPPSEASWESNSSETWDQRADDLSSESWRPDTGETASESPWEPATEMLPRIDEQPDRPYADTARHRKAPDPYEPSDRTYDNGPADDLPPAPQDVRVAGGLDPLSDGPIDSSADVGTPLADESWESIRRGFDRLKEDTRNWDPIGKNDASEPERESTQGAYNETISMPTVSPDDENPPRK